MSEWGVPVIVDLPPDDLVVCCYPNGPIDPAIMKCFVGAFRGINANGTWRVQVEGIVSDLKQAVFRSNV